MSKKFLALVFLLVVALMGCSSSEEAATTTTVAGDDHNSRDEMFASMMIAHHEQAVTMSKLADTKAGDARVKSLADRIEGAQQPEIDQMKTWLNQWGVPYSAEEHAGHSMPGMMTNDEMAQLTAAAGRDFDRRFLDMMIRHHQGAITMTDEVVARGQSREVKDFARNIDRVQNAEIKEMQDLLSRI